MKELTSTEFNKVSAIFEKIDHSVAIVHSVLEGNSPGRVFVDDPKSPRVAFLLPVGTFYYIAGNENSEVLRRELAPLLFKQLLPASPDKELVLFSFSDTWRERLDQLLRGRGVIRISRLMFSFNPGKFKDLRDGMAKVPEGFVMRPIDTVLAEKHPSLMPVVDPRSKRLGVCLMAGEEIVSTCSAVCVGKGEAEIDISTAEKYRDKGFATLTAAAFIEACFVRGLKPNWACWPERRASVALARKLGFEPLPDVPAHFWAEKM
jgi:GNAT superfamily N-acetyltransferase